MSQKKNCRKYPNGGHGTIGYVQHPGLYMVWLHHNLEMFKVYYLILGIQFLPPWSNMWTTILAIRIASWELLVVCYSFGRFFLQPCLHLQSSLSTSKTVDIKDNYFLVGGILKSFGYFFLQSCLHCYQNLSTSKIVDITRQITFATTTTTKMQLWVVVFFCFFSFLFQVCS